MAPPVVPPGAKKPPPPPDFSDPAPSAPTTGGSAPPGTSGGAARVDPGKAAYESGLISLYLGLWGINPAPGYIKGIMATGMNIFEFEAHERAKPAFKFSTRYNEERLGIGLGLAERFGAI